MQTTRSQNTDSVIARNFARDIVRSSLTKQVIRVGGFTRVPFAGAEDKIKESLQRLPFPRIRKDAEVAEATEETLEHLRKVFHDYADGGSAPSASRPLLPDLILPTATANFSDAPVGGWSSLSLWPDGAYQFSGDLRDSGAFSYDDSVVWVVASCTGTAFVFAHQGRLHGTFEKGPRDDDWSDSDTHQAIADAWGDLSNCWQYQCTFAVNADIGELVDAATAALAVAGKVITVVGAV
jgi:hypothetical protein